MTAEAGESVAMLAEWYLWIKAFHVMAVIAWMAGLFYLPRLFVYHADAGEEVMKATFRIMERRLYRAIMWPAMVAAWAAGLVLTGIIGLVHGWLHAKLLLVTAMTAYHLWLGHYVKRFAKGQPVPGSRHFRIINEIPTLLMIGIVLLAVVKPF